LVITENALKSGTGGAKVHSMETIVKITVQHPHGRGQCKILGRRSKVNGLDWTHSGWVGEKGGRTAGTVPNDAKGRSGTAFGITGGVRGKNDAKKKKHKTAKKTKWAPEGSPSAIATSAEQPIVPLVRDQKIVTQPWERETSLLQEKIWGRIIARKKSRGKIQRNIPRRGRSGNGKTGGKEGTLQGSRRKSL